MSNNQTEELTILIDKDGNVSVSVSGVVGTGCKALTSNLERALGVKVSDTAKPEMYEQTQNVGAKRYA